jgi:IS605 OrfB family transposase
MKKKDSFYKTINIEFKPNEEAENMLNKNCDKRHYLYNKGVEIIKKIQERHELGYITINKYELLRLLRNMYEFTNINNPDYLEDYDYYFRGIVECVVDDIELTCRKIILNRSLGKSSDIRFRKYESNHKSFRFKNKLGKRKNGTGASNRLLLTENPYYIKLKINKVYSKQGIYMELNLIEPITNFDININCIREIGIMFHNDRWFLQLFIDCTEEYSNIEVHYKRKEVAGIDLGETNPVVIYDGKIVKIPKQHQFPLDRIKRQEKRLARLQRILDKKYKPELGKFNQSKNYYKVLKKFYKVWDKIVNIKKDWHFKLVHWIVTHYRNIVVDEFENYIIPEDSNYSTRKRRNCNRSMLNKAIYEFNRRLIHMCHKYGTNYFVPHEILETTNTCSYCGHVNETKLRLDENHNERTFICESCNTCEDRDINASINCYNAYYDNLIVTI